MARVAQQWAGIDRAAMTIPRIGDEVLVEFEHGDARRPVVVGSLFNGNAPPPEELPANRTKTVWRTRSVDGPGGNGAGRWPHCRWAVYIAEESQPYEQHPNLETVAKSLLATIPVIMKALDVFSASGSR